MSIAEKIINCEVCKKYAILLTGSPYNDVVSDAIHKALKAEAKGTEIINHKSYFYSCLTSVKIDKVRKEAVARLYSRNYKYIYSDVEPEFDIEENKEKEALSYFLNSKDESLAELKEEIKNKLLGNVYCEIKIQLAYKKIRDGYNLFNDSSK